MLLLGTTMWTIKGVTIYPDHADASQFWYLPAPVKLAERDNRKQFTLIKYKPAAVSKGVTGGGFLIFDVDLTLDPNTEREIRSVLEDETPEPDKLKLAAAPFDMGTVRCIALNLSGGGGAKAEVAETGHFNAVEVINGATTPSLSGNNTATFSLSLSQEGVTILDRAFSEATTPVGVIYDLKYTAMRPNLNIKISADMHRVFNHLSASLEGQYAIVSGGIDAGLESMKKDGTIKMEVIDYVNDADREEKENWAMEFFKTELLGKFFEPTLQPGEFKTSIADAESMDSVITRGGKLSKLSPGAKTSGSGTTDTATKENTSKKGESDTVDKLVDTAIDFISRDSTTANALMSTASGLPVISFKLKAIHQVESGEQVFHYDRQVATQRTYAPQGSFGLMLKDLEKASHFVEVDLDDPFFREFSVRIRPPSDFEKIGLKSAAASIDYGTPMDPAALKHGDFVFDAQDTSEKEFSTFLNKDFDLNYKHQIKFSFDAASDWIGEKITYELPTEETINRTLFLSPREHLGFLQVNVFADDVDWRVIRLAEVQLAYKDSSGWAPPKQLLRLTEDESEQTWKLRLSHPEQREYEYKIVYHLKDGSTEETALTRTDISAIPVTYQSDLLDVKIMPRLIKWERDGVDLLVLSLRYSDPENEIQQQQELTFTPEDNAEQTWSIEIKNRDKRQYQWQAVFYMTDGNEKNTDWQMNDKSVLILKLPT